MLGQQEYFDLSLVELQRWLWLDELQVWRNVAVLEYKNGFEQAGNAGRRLEVPDVSFDGTNVKIVSPSRILTEYTGDGRNLFSITYLSPLSRNPSAQLHVSMWDAYSAVSLDE